MSKKVINIVFTGTPGCGKTTAVHTMGNLSSIDNNSVAPRTTTIGQDYSELELDGDIVLRSYGTPGQQRFSFIWELLSVQADCLIIMVDSKRPTPFNDMDMYLENFKALINRVPALICVVKNDNPNLPTAADYQQHLTNLDFNLPVIFADSKSPSDMSQAIGQLLELASFTEPAAESS